MSASRWLWLAASMLLATRSARAEPFACRACAQHLDLRAASARSTCPTTTAGTRGWIHGALTVVAPPTYRCEASDHPIPLPEGLLDKPVAPPDPKTGCILVEGTPACEGLDGPVHITVGIDGVARDVPAWVGLRWTTCGLAPGRHAVTMCTPRGAVTCEIEFAAGATSGQDLVPVDAELRVRVDRVYTGDPALVGRELSFRYAVAADWSGELGLPAQADLVWTETGPKPYVQICAPPPDVAAARRPPVTHGCARCDGAGDLSTIVVIAAIGFLLLRRRC
jgi:hypothetical protein